MKKVFGLLGLLLLLMVSGCAAPTPRSDSSDQGIKRVAVVSLLDEESPLKTIGLTIFNNKASAVSHEGQLNDIATKTIEASLRSSRPRWELVSASAELPRLLDRRKGIASVFVLSGLKADLAQLAQKLNVDAIFVLLPSRWDDTGERGVGVRMYAGPLRDSQTVHVHSILSLSMVDRHGEGVAYRTGMNPQESMPATSLGLVPDASGTPSPEALAAVKTALQRRMVQSLQTALTSMGY